MDKCCVEWSLQKNKFFKNINSKNCEYRVVSEEVILRKSDVI